MKKIKKLPFAGDHYTFGPVVSVTTFKDEAEALQIANETLYGLGAGLWTRDMSTAYRLGRAIQAGRVWTNCYHVFLGRIAGCPFYIGGQQFEYWRHTHLTIDIVPGRGSGFSVEAPEGKRFLTRSRLFTEEEDAQLQAEGDPPRGLQTVAA